MRTVLIVAVLMFCAVNLTAQTNPAYAGKSFTIEASIDPIHPLDMRGTIGKTFDKVEVMLSAEVYNAIGFSSFDLSVAHLFLDKNIFLGLGPQVGIVDGQGAVGSFLKGGVRIYSGFKIGAYAKYYASETRGFTYENRVFLAYDF
jgi:hypothetical protein